MNKKIFNIRQVNEIVGGLTFQITYAYHDQYIFEQSIVIQETAFALLEMIFIMSYQQDIELHQYYHWHHNFHDLQQIAWIIDQLNLMITQLKHNTFDFYHIRWLNDKERNFLKQNTQDLFILYKR